MNRKAKDCDKEKNMHYFIVDLLAHEYGWTIEYIQELTMTEVMGLIRKIRERLDEEDIRHQINVAKGFSGKIGSNRDTSGKSKEEKEVEELEKLAKVLKVPIKKVEEDGV